MPPALVRPYVRVIPHHQIPPAAYPRRSPVPVRPVPADYRPRHVWTVTAVQPTTTASRRAGGRRRYPAVAWGVLILTLSATGLGLAAGDRPATSADGEPVTAAQAGHLQVARVPVQDAIPAAPAQPAVPSGPLVGPAARCLDARSGAPVQLRTCTGAAAQIWSAPADGTLRTVDQCLQPSGNRLRMLPCTGAEVQQWQLAHGTLASRASHQCLTANAAGGPARLARCDRSAGQRWALPYTGRN